MTVRAKFFVSGIHYAHVTQGVYSTVKMAPVYGEANKPWSEATPQGEITMSITNPDAVDKFELGKAYFVDFSPAD